MTKLVCDSNNRHKPRDVVLKVQGCGKPCIECPLTRSNGTNASSRTTVLADKGETKEATVKVTMGQGVGKAHVVPVATNGVSERKDTQEVLAANV